MPLAWQRRIVREALVLLALTAALWLFHIYGRTLPTLAVTIVWVLVGALAAWGLLRRARVRRAAFLSAYVLSTSPLERRLRGGVLMAARSLVAGLAVAALLGVALLRLDAAGWVVLLTAVPVLVVTRTLSVSALEKHASAEYLPELAARVSIAIAAAIIAAALVAVAFHRAYPALHGVSLEQAVWHFVDVERARSAAGQTLLQMAAAKDALRLWLAQQLMPAPGTSLAQAAGWLVVLAEEALFAWSYLVLCTAALMATDAATRSRA